MIDWSSPQWGQQGHNVHKSETGSWSVPTERDREK